MSVAVGGLILLTGWLLPRLGDNAGDEGPTATVEPADVDTDVVLACVEALEPACDVAASVLGVASDVWGPGDPLPDAGVLLAPSAELPDGTESGEVTAVTPIVISGWRTRWQPLEIFCDDAVDAACLAAAAGQIWSDLGGSDDWGSFKLGLADPSLSEAGLLAWSLVEPELATPSLAATLRLTSATDAELMADLVLFGDSRADVVVTTEVAVAGQFQNAISRGDGRLEIGYPTSGPWVEYVAVPIGRSGRNLADRLSEEGVARALTGTGLRPASGPVGELPEGLGEPGSQTPNPDDQTRARLIQSWEDST